MQYYPFDSRNKLYKSVYGAVASGQSLKLRLLLHRDACVNEAFLRITNDETNELNEIKLEASDWLEDYRFYDTDIILDEGLYWYDFRYTSAHGEFFVTKQEHSLGTVSAEGKKWQLTVYDKDFVTPDWLKGGLIYQIFPDRFYKANTKTNIQDFNDRYIQSDWSALPEHAQHDNLKYLGNDYFGGNLKGIEQKLNYLESLGVTAIYLNPIFEAHSNHRYNTADYLKIDALLGIDKDLSSLCKSAAKRGISVILDGVFSHTGDDSVYFNKYGRYSTLGAFQSKDSPYYSWYKFEDFPNKYQSWWGITTLPETIETDKNFNDFITGENGVIKHWMKQGVKGWRLDVADELPDEILDNIRTAIKTQDKNGFLLGEVWEDATNKISHGGRRRFLRGKQLDSVMNYPFAEAIIAFLKGGNSRELIDTVLDITENYPPQTVSLLMNHIGTHDTARILTRLSDAYANNSDRNWQAQQVLSQQDYNKAVKFLKMAAVLQYTLPGVPSLYYGDEAGMQGYGDPFCRKTYPWGNEDADLIEFYKALGKLRKENSCFKDGEFAPIYANMGHIVYMRKNSENAVIIAVNRWCDDAFCEIPEEFSDCKVLFGQKPENNILKIESESFAILIK